MRDLRRMPGSHFVGVTHFSISFLLPSALRSQARSGGAAEGDPIQMEVTAERASLSALDAEGDHMNDGRRHDTTDGISAGAGRGAQTKRNPATTINVDLSMGSEELSMGPADGTSAFSSDQTGCLDCKKKLDTYKKQSGTYRKQLDTYKKQVDTYKKQLDTYKRQLDTCEISSRTKGKDMKVFLASRQLVGALEKI